MSETEDFGKQIVTAMKAAVRFAEGKALKEVRPMRVVLHCKLFKSAFSGEVVFAFDTADGLEYEGVAPKHYATPTHCLSEKATIGDLNVQMIERDTNSSWIRLPDGEAVEVFDRQIVEIQYLGAG